MLETLGKFNQDEIDSWDQHSWRHERDTIYKRIVRWCQANGITFNNINRYFFNKNILNASAEKIVYVQLFDPLPYSSTWQEISEYCKKSGQEVFVITDNLAEFGALEHIHFFSIHEFLGQSSSYGDQYLNETIKKSLYNCFIQRVDSIRQSWFYFLKNKNLLDKGYVSFLLKQMEIYSGNRTGKDLYDYIHTQYQLNALPHFEQAYHELRDLVPYRNFPEENNLLPLILDSKYSLTLETCAVEDDIGYWCWTEKSLRDLQLPVLTLPFWQKKSAEKLSNLGFALPEYLWDFDNDPWTERQQKLLQILENDSIIYNYSECFERAVHNRQLLSEWKNTYQKPNFLDSVYEEILAT